MNLQEIFNKVRRHLLTQNVRAMQTEGDGSQICMYRGANGTACAIGCLITDKAYTPEIERRPGDDILVRRALIKSNVIDEATEGTCPFDKVNLLCDLQTIHDEYMTDEWKDELTELARKYNLKVED